MLLHAEQWLRWEVACADDDTFKLGISAAVPLVLENCPNDRVIPNDFLGILILVKVGGHLLTPIKLQRPTFRTKLVKRVDFRATLFMPQIPGC